MNVLQVNLGASLISRIRADLHDVAAVRLLLVHIFLLYRFCSGVPCGAQTEQRDARTHQLPPEGTGEREREEWNEASCCCQVPVHWLAYTVPRDVSLKEWLSDLSERMKQLQRVAVSGSLRAEPVS